MELCRYAIKYLCEVFSRISLAVYMYTSHIITNTKCNMLYVNKMIFKFDGKCGAYCIYRNAIIHIL